MSAETYEKNLNIIKTLFPLFHEYITKTPDVDWLRKTSEDWEPVNFSVRMSNSGSTIPMWKDRPDEDYLGLVENSKELPLHNQTVTLLFGVDNGHGLRLILDKKEPRHTVILVEPVMQLLRAALFEKDFSKEIGEGTLLFAPGKVELAHVISFVQSTKVVPEWGWGVLVSHRTAKNRPEYWDLIDHGLEIINQEVNNTGTVAGHGLEMANNDISTLPHLIRSRGVSELKGLFKDKPVIVVATGPSLARNIHLLKEVYIRKTAVIIAVAQALRPLLAYGIRPDFICTVDFGVVNLSHLAGLMDETVPLITVNKTYAPMLKAYKGPKFVSVSIGDDEPEDSAHTVLKSCGGLLQGGSVLHTCYGLAIWMECNPVILVGVNLALEENSHFAQVDSGGKVTVGPDGNIRWKVEDPRSNLSKYESHGMGPARSVDGYFGNKVLTNMGLLTFITTLEGYVRLFSENGTITCDCTEGGAYKKGAKRKYLTRAIAEYCKEPIDKSVIEPLLTPSPDGEARIDKVIPIMEREIRDMREAQYNAEQGIRYAKKMKKHYRQEDLLNDYALNSKHTAAAAEKCKRVPLLLFALFRATREIESRELAADDFFDLVKRLKKEGKTDAEIGPITAKHLIENKNDQDKRVRQNIHILTAVVEAASSLLKTYTNSLTLLQRYRAGEADVLDPTGETTPPNLDDAETYFAQGNWARPLLEAVRMLPDQHRDKPAWNVIKRAEDMRETEETLAERLQCADAESGRINLPEYLDMVEESKVLGREKKYDESLAVLEKAVAMMPKEKEARWGLGTALHYAGRLAESEATFKEMVRLFPESTRARFELGQVIMHTGRWDEGYELVLEAIEQNPKEHGHYRKELAIMCLEIGDRGKALKLLGAHLKQFPNDDECLKIIDGVEQRQIMEEENRLTNSTQL